MGGRGSLRDDVSDWVPGGAKVLSKPPEGWRKNTRAQNVRKGYAWYDNGKSRFSGEFKQVLVREKRR